MTAQELATQLRARKTGTGWLARCPSHTDRKASLSIGAGDDGRVLLKCHAGCSFAELLNAMGLKAGDLFPDSGTPKYSRKRPPVNSEATKPILKQQHDGVWWWAKWETITPLHKPVQPFLGWSLGLPEGPLIDLGYRWITKGCWGIPLYNHLGMCGIQYRGSDGHKWLERGSQCALFIPRSYREGLLVICEGATDTAAMLSAGFDAIGRFNATQSPQFIIDWLEPQDRRDVALVVDDGQAGADGAQMVADALRAHTKSVRMVTPGRFKDAREWAARVPGRMIRETIHAAVRI